MKKCSFKILATILSIAMLLSCFLPAGLVSALEADDFTIPSMPQAGKMFVIHEGLKYQTSLGPAKLNQDHLPGCSSDLMYVSDPRFETYEYFQLDFFVENIDNFRTREVRLEFVIRRNSGSESKIYNFEDQITKNGWNHIQIAATYNNDTEKSWLRGAKQVRIYIYATESEVGSMDIIQVANVCATKEVTEEDLAPEMPQSAGMYLIDKGIKYEGVLGNSAIDQGHHPGYGASDLTKTPNSKFDTYDFFEFDYYVENVQNFKSRVTKLEFATREFSTGSNRSKTYEFQDQITQNGWNHVKIAITWDSEEERIAIRNCEEVACYITTIAGEAGANEAFKIANICATIDHLNKVPEIPTSTGALEIHKGIKYDGVLGSNAIDQGNHPGYTVADAIIVSGVELDNYYYLEFDYLVEDAISFNKRVSKLEVCIDSSSGGGTKLYEFKDQVTMIGWNHVKIRLSYDNENEQGILNKVEQIKFYITMAAGEEGAESIYKVANVYATYPNYVVPEGSENVLLGAIPVAFYTTAKEAFSFNWQTGYIAVGDKEYTGHGYLETAGWERRVNFVDYLKYLTDGDDSVKVTIADQDGSKGSSNAWVCIVYELPDTYDLNGVEVILPSWDDKVDIYVSSSRSDIFNVDNMVASVVREESKYKSPNAVFIDKPGAKFVGLYVKDVYDSGICEIKAYAPATEKMGDNLIKDKTPVAAYAVNDGTTTFAYRPVGTNSDDKVHYGYKTRPGSSENPDFDYVAAELTDGYTVTSATIKTEYGTNNKDDAIDDDILMAYKLDALSSVNGIRLDAGDIPRNTKVYLSSSYASLFNASNLVYTYTSNEDDTGFKVKFDKAKDALYVGFVFECDQTNPGQPIQNIYVYGTVYQTNDYSEVLGESLINPNANEETKYFYNYLSGMGNANGTLLGAEINITTGDADKRGNNDNYLDFIGQEYGITPAIVSTQWKADISLYKDYYEEGTLPLIAIPGASSATVNNYEEETGGSITGFIKYYDADYEPTESEEELYYTIQDEVWESYRDQADFFEELEAAGVKSYIVRPFIEMNLKGVYGDTNWGNDRRENFKNVWRQMVDYFVNERQLEGIIFAFSPSAIDNSKWFDPMDYYPGNEYVDIIAPTIYAANDDGVLHQITDYDELIATGKPFAISEIGLIRHHETTTRTDCMNLLNSIKTVYPTASFVNLWYGRNFGINVHENADKFINDDYIITVEDMQKPQLGNLGDAPVELYATAGYSGDCTAAFAGKYNDIAAFNSIKIADGYMVTISQNSDFAVGNWCFGKDVNDLTDLDVTNINSIKIEKIGEYMQNDVNNDGEVDIRDLVRAKKLAVGVSVTGNVLAADSNSNGRIEAEDLSIFRKFLLSFKLL